MSHLFVRLQVRVRRLFLRDLLSLRFYGRRLRKQGLGRAIASFVQTKIPYALPLPRLPYVIGIEPTTHCNIQCVMCPSPGYQSPRGYMALDLYDSVIEQAARGGSHRVRFVGLGEPLLHPELPEMVRRAKRLGLYTEISTNATLLTRERGAALIEAGLDEIGFSLDSADEAEYERIRKGARFREVIDNIDGFLALCAASRRRAPITVARMVVMPGSDAVAFARRWRGKVDSLQFNEGRLYDRSGLDARVRRGTQAAPTPAQLPRKVRCRQVMHKLLIGWDGGVGLCNQSSVIIGDARTTPLEEIWRGHVLETMRRLHRRYDGARVDVCRACPVMEPMVGPDAAGSAGQVTVRTPWRDEQVDGPTLVPLRRRARG